jgi:two-component system sensor histidine kinase HydH
LNAVVERALRLVQSDADARQIQVVFVPEKALPLLALDVERLTQALLNLFLNAVQAMDTHGVLRVETLFDGADKKRVLVRIADTGCGISHSQLAGIFNPYFTTKLSGTGLGLAIVHRIIEAHGADIGVQSEAGQGTLFTLAFPCEVQ